MYASQDALYISVFSYCLLSKMFKMGLAVIKVCSLHISLFIQAIAQVQEKVTVQEKLTAQEKLSYGVSTDELTAKMGTTLTIHFQYFLIQSQLFKRS